MWYFPAGMPHSLQATGESEDGAEFVLVSEPCSLEECPRPEHDVIQAFPDGSFSDESTFSVSPYLEVL